MGDEDYTESAKKIAKERIRLMPSHLELHIGNYGDFDKNELIDEIEKDSKIGKIAVEMQLNALRSFKSV